MGTYICACAQHCDELLTRSMCVRACVLVGWICGLHLLPQMYVIHDFARVFRTVQPGISWEHTVGALVRGNEISHAPHVGIIGAHGNGV